MGEPFRSEQDENLELADEAPAEDPPSWAEQDPDHAEPADPATADQLTKPCGSGATRIDDEPG